MLAMGRSGAVHQDWDEAAFVYDLITVGAPGARVKTKSVDDDELD